MDKRAMSKTLVVVAVCVFLLVSSSVAQQYLAYQYGYHPGLGRPVALWHGHALYLPGMGWSWWRAYGTRDQALYRRAMHLGGLAGLLGMLGLVQIARAKRQRTTPDTHGSSRWATKADVDTMGLYNRHGIVLGIFPGKFFRYRRTILRSAGEEQVFLVGPQRSGKGTTVIIPTLYDYPASVVVFDIRGESYRDTATYRSRFSDVLLFHPTSKKTVRYDFIKALRPGPNLVRDCQNLSMTLTDPSGQAERRNDRDHWRLSSQTLLQGMMLFSLLHVYTHEEDKSPGGLVRFLSDPYRPIPDIIDTMLTGLSSEMMANSVVASIAGELSKKEPRELSGILSTTLSYLSLFRDNLVDHATSASDFEIEDLRNPNRPLSLYIHIPPGDIDRLGPLYRVMLRQMLDRLTDVFDPAQPEILFILDELPALGHMAFLNSAFSYLAGNKIRVLVACQGLHQFEQVYGPHNNIMPSCAIALIFAPNDKVTRHAISDALDKTTIETTSHTKRREIAELFHDQRYRNVSYTSRPLLFPNEVSRMSREESLLLMTHHYPVRLQKISKHEQRVYPHFRRGRVA